MLSLPTFPTKLPTVSARTRARGHIICAAVGLPDSFSAGRGHAGTPGVAPRHCRLQGAARSLNCAEAVSERRHDRRHLKDYDQFVSTPNGQSRINTQVRGLASSKKSCRNLPLRRRSSLPGIWAGCLSCWPPAVRRLEVLIEQLPTAHQTGESRVCRNRVSHAVASLHLPQL